MSEHQKNAELTRFQVFCWQVATQNSTPVVTPYVMALAIMTSGPNSVTKILELMGVQTALLIADLDSSLQKSLPKKRPKTIDCGSISLSEGGGEIIKIATEVCELMGDPAMGTHHILLAILKSHPLLSGLFSKYNVTFSKLRAVVKESLTAESSVETAAKDAQKKEKTTDGTVPQNQQSTQKKPQALSDKDVLAKYCKNLTMLASQGKLDPVIGRENEVCRLITTLGRRKKNNAILIGEPGVGKTAVMEGLAQRISCNNVPSHMRTKQIFQLNMTAVVSKTTYRGQFEERMRAIVDVFSNNKDYVLFIDEIHTLVGAGGSIGGLDAANIIKPALANGELRCVGATTEDEYQKYFKKDGALDRRFQRIFINEPSKDETVKILLGIKSVIESHHCCSISEEVIRCAVDLSSRYILDRHLPDKAIDCLDEACSSAVSLRFVKGEKTEIKKADIITAVASQTDMPEEIVGISDVNKARSLDSYLKTKIIGQNEAIDQVSSVLLSAYAGIRDHKKPIGCFVFGGPPSAGTTFMAEKIAEGLFDSEESLIRINMSEMSEQFGNTKLIGSPPGYVGYGDRNQLTDKVARRPYCLILLDGIEKANSDVIKLFIQAMSSGVMTDASGHHISFRNAVIVMTMLCKSSMKSSRLGFGEHSGSLASSQKESLISECQERFGDDFVNQIDEFVVFSELSKDDIHKVTTLKVNDLVERIRSTGRSVVCAVDDVVDTILSKCTKEDRLPTIKDVDRYIKRDVEPIVSRFLSDQTCLESQVCLVVESGKIVCGFCKKAMERSI